MKEDVLTSFFEYAGELLETKSVLSMGRFIQHGEVTCLEHCIGVAIFSLILVRVLRIRCDERSLVRGALLHDYFLYDWHVKAAAEKAPFYKLHGFTHAKAALHNAERDFQLNDIEREIIEKHMWPLNRSFPKCREAWVVNFVDTYCSGLETVGRFGIFKPLQKMVVNAPVLPEA